MTFHKFCKFIIQNRPEILSSGSLPSSINLDSNVWNAIKKLREFTDSYGYEHSISIFWVDNDIFITPPKKGSKESVYTKNEVALKYIPFDTKVGVFYRKEVVHNGKLVFKKSIKKQDLPDKPAVREIFTLHSHPRALDSNGPAFSFFSVQDISSLLASNGICLGLLTDHLFLICKTQNSPQRVTSEIVELISKGNSVYQLENHIDPLPFNKLGLILYQGNISDKLKRIN